MAVATTNPPSMSRHPAQIREPNGCVELSLLRMGAIIGWVFMLWVSWESQVEDAILHVQTKRPGFARLWGVTLLLRFHRKREGEIRDGGEEGYITVI